MFVTDATRRMRWVAPLSVLTPAVPLFAAMVVGERLGLAVVPALALVTGAASATSP